MRWTRRSGSGTPPTTRSWSSSTSHTWTPSSARSYSGRCGITGRSVDWDFVIEEKDYDNGMKVFIPVAVEKPIPYRHAVDMGFVKNAHAKIKP